MAYSEMRLRREVQQLRRELNSAKDRERRTREGCMDLVHALARIVSSPGGSGAEEAPTASDLVERAGLLLAPDSGGP